MRRFLEFKGQSFHLDYDGADFVIKTILSLRPRSIPAQPSAGDRGQTFLAGNRCQASSLECSVRVSSQ
jgi:hypothetical protein